jgi:hypothetical protein
MAVWRSPLIPIGVVVLLLGAGNWYTGWSKMLEYEALLRRGGAPPAVQDFDDFSHLTTRTNAMLLAPLQNVSIDYTFTHARLDFYQVVRSGGRMLMLAGMLLIATGLARSWYRQSALDERPLSSGP